MITEKRLIDLLLRTGLIVFLLSWCAMILQPFVSILLWSMILAVTLFPLYQKLSGSLNNKSNLAAIILSAALLIVILAPVILLLSSIVGELQYLSHAFHSGDLQIPPPNSSVESWPVVGHFIFSTWSELNVNLQQYIVNHKDQLLHIGQFIFSSLKSITGNTLMFCGSIIISGVLLATSDQGNKAAVKITRRIAGDGGDEFISVIIQTVRNVAKGIIGVAFIQFALMGVIFLLAGVPFAGIWALLVLVLALVQLPTTIIALPVIIYIFSVKEMLPAILFSITILLAGLSDNVLKPILMGKGAPVPMLVIFLGSIGGFIFSGFVGLFTGAIVLSLGYKILNLWLEEKNH